MTLYTVISDVHGNLEALGSVLDAIKNEIPGAILFLGDSVGYGPNPNECINILKRKTEIMLPGNHDNAALGLTTMENFNPYARAAIEWTKEVLNSENKDFLNRLPLTRALKGDSIFLVHSSPKEPEQWHYLQHTGDARVNFSFFSENMCFIGHSHVPFIMEQNPEGTITVCKDRADIRHGHRYIINAGSVGQPRDGNPEAAYALLHNNVVEIKRVSYDIVLTQKKMRDVGLPSFLFERLSKGI